ncbi:hypothetical protein TELCIR_18691, partial [Teladorsagia circumcincta]
NRLLAAFLPQHLITAARLQIATSNPHIYAEHYPQYFMSLTVFSFTVGYDQPISSGVFITEETRRFVDNHFNLEHVGEIWRVHGDTAGPELFPVNKRFSMVTVPQGINRLLQTLSTIDPHVKTIGTTKKRLITSLALIVVALTLMFFILLMLYINYFHGVEESSSKDRFLLLNSQVLLNLVPPHVAPWVVARTGEQWHHAHHSVGVAYMTISGFNLADEQGLNGLNYVFTSFDQQLSNYRGIEKIKSANRFYIVAVGLLPDAAQNVNETPWTIGELLHTLAQFLLQATQFATDKEFQVQIGRQRRRGSSKSSLRHPFSWLKR